MAYAIPTASGTQPDIREATLRLVQRRMALAIAAPVLLLAYFVYAWSAFNVSALIARADPNRMALLAVDTAFHKVHVEENLRRGGLTVAVEGERTATFRPGAEPDWVTRDGDRTVVDLGAGHLVEMAGRDVRFTVPGYGTIAVRVTDDAVEADLPPGPVPGWISGNAMKFDARPDFTRRLQVSRAKTEVHRYFFGWENFWFDFGHPLDGKTLGELVGLAFSADRLDPARSNVRYMIDGFLGNQRWQHAAVFVALYETLLMAVLGTITAFFVALPLAFLAARNFTPSMALRFAIRRVFDFVRAVDSLIWSLIFIRAFGLGPLTGSLAIAITDTGSLGKLFSEALENIDMKQVEGVTSTGASRVQQYRYGVIPQLLPVLLSQGLYYLESNTRSATVIGALGAGGIGLMLVQTIGTSRNWENTAYLILLTLVLVIVIDNFSTWLRQRLIVGKPDTRVTVAGPVAASARLA